MWILVAEALGALGLLLFIVWWTLGPTQRRERDALRDLARDVTHNDAGRAAAGADAKPSAEADDPPPRR